MLGKLPTQLHPIIADDLRQFDRNYQALAQQYAPFKSFVQQGQSADDLRMGVELVNLLNNSPQEFYRRLGEQLGISPEEAQQEVEGQEQYDDEGYSVDPRDQQIQMLQQQMQEMYDYQQQSYAEQQYQQEVAQNEAQLDQEIEALKQHDPNVDVVDVLQRIYMQTAQNQPINVPQAYQDHLAYVNRIRGQVISTTQPGANAPRVVPTNGGMPPTAQNNQPQTADQRVARAAAMIQAASQ